MAITVEIRDEKPRCNVNRKATEISALKSGKSDEYEYPTKRNQTNHIFFVSRKNLRKQYVTI